MTKIVLAAVGAAFALLCVALVVYTNAPGPVEDLDPGLAGLSGLSGGIAIPKPTLTPNQVKTLQNYEDTRLKLLGVIRKLEGKLAGVSRPVVDLRVATVGSKGPPGPQGKKGVVGPPGIQGPMGKLGPMGPPGKQGPAGPLGAAGPAGPPGSPGRQGAVGPKGPRAARGERGDRGPPGPRGRPGRVGPRGRQGLLGPRGDQGPRGHRGLRGATGSRGQAGAPPPAPGVLKGKIINVMNGRALTGVALRVKHHGRLVKNVGVDRNGKFRARISPGQYLLEGVARGFQHFHRTITIESARTLRHRVFMSPTLASGEMRLVLTWNKRISDLDMHLSTPSGCKVGWTNKKCYSSAAKASLDVDDVNGEGPETITIHKLQAGTYKLWIHRYSAGNMLRSDATVRAFFPSGVMRVYRVGTDGSLAGSKWNVLTIDGATGNLFGPVMEGTRWVSVPGSPAVFTGLSTSQSGLNVWAAANGNVYRRRGVSFAKRMGLGWSQVPGATAYGVAASDLGVWVWNRAGQIFARSGVTPANPTGTGWLPVPKPSPTSNIRTMSYDGANGVATTVDGRVWWRAGITAANPKGSRWFQVPGRMDWIGVYSNTMWATRNGRVYRRLNMARSPPTGSGWQRVPGLGRRVGVSNGSVWLTSRTGRCFFRKGIRGNNRAGASWGQLPANSRRITQIAVGNGVVWGLDNNHSPVFRSGVAQTGSG